MATVAFRMDFPEALDMEAARLAELTGTEWGRSAVLRRAVESYLLGCHKVCRHWTVRLGGHAPVAIQSALPPHMDIRAHAQSVAIAAVPHIVGDAPPWGETLMLTADHDSARRFFVWVRFYSEDEAEACGLHGRCYIATRSTTKKTTDEGDWIGAALVDDAEE